MGLVAKNVSKIQNVGFPISSSDPMINHEFKWKHFAPEIILLVSSLVWFDTNELREYQRHAGRARDFGEPFDHLSSWFIEYSPVLRKKLRRYQFIRVDSSWQLDETYVKVKGKWFYLYRAINKQGETLDFYFF